MVAICHGVNSHGGQYAWTAEQLAARGFAVYAVDLRGRGKSEGERFYVEDVADYVADIGGLIAIAKERHPGLPVYLLGHSAGGVVSCIYALDHQDELAGLICESFAFQVPAPDFVLAALKGLSHIAPRLGVLTLKMKDFTRDPEALRGARGRSADQGRDAAGGDGGGAGPRRRAAARLLRADHAAGADPARHRRPRDGLPGSEFFYEHAGSADKTLKLYEGHYHDLLNDIGKEEVLADIARLDRGAAAGDGEPDGLRAGAAGPGQGRSGRSRS